MKIRNEVLIKRPIGEVWAAISDIPRVARCAPGAELIESRSDDTHVGTIGVRLGPVALKFKGIVQFLERDEAGYRIVAKAQGNEEKARGNANADVIFALTPADGGTRISVDSDIQLAGSIAQYGRGTALIQGTAQALMAQFAKNLEASLSDPDSTEAGASKEIGLTSTLAKGIWNAGAGMLRRGDADKD